MEHIICKKEKEINEISVGIAEIKGDVKTLNTRINGSMEKIASHMTEGEGYRRLIIGTALSLVLTILGGVTATWVITSQLGYTMGQFANQIKVNTGRLDKVEAFHEHLTKQQAGIRV